MDFLVGQAVAYLKISSLALVIMVGVWVLAKVFVTLHDRNNSRPDDDGPDKSTPPLRR